MKGFVHACLFVLHKRLRSGLMLDSLVEGMTATHAFAGSYKRLETADAAAAAAAAAVVVVVVVVIIIIIIIIIIMLMCPVSPLAES
jgi:t-SNARE complex subunit (syntaxin)